MKQKIILIGGGGHCKSCIDVIEQGNEYEIAGIIDVKEKIGDDIFGYPIIAADDDIDQLSKEYDYFLITIGQIASPKLRENLYRKVKATGKKLPVIISPRAHVSEHSSIGEGTIIMHDVIINSNVTIGKNCIINTKALIEHDSNVGDSCHIATSAVINGGVNVDNYCFVGSNATILQEVKITKMTVVGAATLVTKNIDKAGVYKGVPAKLERK